MHGADRDGWADGRDGREDRPRDSERRQPDEDRVYGITTAETSHMQEITRRQKQYILTMLVRVVSIIVVVVVPGISWPVKIGLCLVATIIPYVAVVRANGGPTQEKDPTNLMFEQRHRELGPPERGLPPADERPNFIVGERVFRDDADSDANADADADEGADAEERGDRRGEGVKRAAEAGRPRAQWAAAGATGEDAERAAHEDAAGRETVTQSQNGGDTPNGAPFGAGRADGRVRQGSEQRPSAR